MKMRTIRKAMSELKEMDSHCCVSEYWLRQAVKNGTIPSFTSGNRVLINFDKLIEYLECNNYTQ